MAIVVPHGSRRAQNTMKTRAELESMSRKELQVNLKLIMEYVNAWPLSCRLSLCVPLQALAKENGIKANGKVE